MNRNNDMELQSGRVAQVVSNRGNPCWGQLVGAAEAVIHEYDENIGLADAEFFPFVSARRILFGDNDAYVTLYDIERFEHPRDSSAFAPIATSAAQMLPAVSSCRCCPVPTGGIGLELSETARNEFATGIQMLGRLGLATLNPNLPSAAIDVPSNVARSQYMKMRDYAVRQDVSISTVKFWRRLGLATNGVKGRGVRIKVVEADAWVEAGGPKLALAAAGARHTRRGGK